MPSWEKLNAWGGPYLEDVVELSLELKVGFGLEDELLEGFLERLDFSLGVLAQLGDSLVLPLTAKALLLGLVHLSSKKEGSPFPTSSSPKTLGVELTSFGHTRFYEQLFE